jgi:hypothetical protein
VPPKLTLMPMCGYRHDTCEGDSVDHETGRFTHADASVVHSREDFISFTDALLGDYRLGGGESEWENNTLSRFLEALSDLAEVGTMSQRDDPTWQAFAQLIAAATGYE